MPHKQVSVILPALNEEATIAKVIDEIPRSEIEGMGYRVEVVVVDNNSTDQTKKMAESKGARVIHEKVRGKGRAIATAFKSVDGDYLFILDADYTYPAEYIPGMLKVLEYNDVVMGSRLNRKMEKGAMSIINRAGNHLLAFMANILYGTRISDLCTGFWGFRNEVIKEIKFNASGFDLEANMFSQIARKHFRIAEVPIHYRRRKTPSKLNSLRDGYLIGRTLINRRFHK
ncbi:MAG: glycosyltransferase [Dehalococcoidales bacterium]|nr:glycosyltransferase [Dehalococcoidales bacterium]